MDLQRSRYT